MSKTNNPQEKLIDDLSGYIQLRLGLCLFPVRRTLLNMDREDLALVIKDQSENISQGIKALVYRHFPKAP